MISCDTNILFAALNSGSVFYEEARRFLESHAGNSSFCICEQVLMEFYGILRNPSVSKPALTPSEAVAVIDEYRNHPTWKRVDFPGSDTRLMDQIWKMASVKDFAYRRIFDARIALTLRHHGVREFATQNIKDFQGFGFQKVWNPLI
jgi:uncharacterized protein